MTSPEHLKELEALAEEQELLRARVERLDARISELRERFAASPAEVEAVPVLPPPLPPLRESASAEPLPASPETIPSPVSKEATSQVELSGAVLDILGAPAPATSGENDAASVAPPATIPTPPPLHAETETATPSVTKAPESLEMQLGTVWMARIGIVILITGFVFLGNYAWQHVITRLGAGGKLTILYVAGGILAGLGRWLEERGESLKNYGRILLGGGAATIYYTTYAAHHVERLRVIESPLVAGILLLVLAGGFIAWADHRRSQAVALIAVALAYYTSAINPIGNFTLFSSLLLTGGTVWLLIRHGWAALGWASLAGTYGSFAFWRWHQTSGGETLAEPLFVGITFLLMYWGLFTWATFATGAIALPTARRVPFLTVNNAAFFGLAAWVVTARDPDLFWVLALLSGAALLGLAAYAWRWRPEDRSLDGAYLAQGLGLVTVGLAAKLSGSQLALTLAIESAILLTAAAARHGRIFQVFAALCAIGAWGMGIDNAGNWIPSSTIAALLIFDGWWLKQRTGSLREMQWDWRTAAFTTFGLFLVGVILDENIPAPWLPTAAALTAIVCTASIYLLRLPELVGSGQLSLVWAIMLLLTPGGSGFLPPWWRPLPVLAATLMLAHWWQRQRILKVAQGRPADVLQVACAIGAIVVGHLWMLRHFEGDRWLVATSIVAFGSLIYGLLSRAWAIALVGQWFSFVAATSFLIAIVAGHPYWAAALTPIAMLLMISLVLRYGQRHLPASASEVPLGIIALGYRLAAHVLLVFWAWEYIPRPWLPLFFGAAAGALFFIGARSTTDRQLAYVGAAFGLLAFFAFFTHRSFGTTWMELAGIILVPLSLRLASALRRGEPLLPAEARTALVACALASTWLWVTRWTYAHWGSQGLTIAWSTLALVVFATGMALRERVYRIGGFALLALAIGRIFFVDVWRLDSLYRTLSFLFLGVVLLLLSFVYNRFGEKIRRWL